MKFLLVLVLLGGTAYADDTCAKLESTADELVRTGARDRAFYAYEKALKCKASEPLYYRAAMNACSLYSSGRSEFHAKAAKRYYPNLTEPHKQVVARACAPSCRLEY